MCNNKKARKEKEDEERRRRKEEEEDYLPSLGIDGRHSRDAFGEEFHEAGVVVFVAAGLPGPVGRQTGRLVRRIYALRVKLRDIQWYISFPD